MKILLINHFPLEGSGSGIYTKNIATSLTKKGHQVCIIMPENRKIKEIEKIKLHPVYFKDKEEIINQLLFNFPCFTTHPYSNKTFYDLTDNELEQYKQKFIEAIKDEVDTFNPDIIHSNHIWILSSIAANFDKPLIVTMHGTDLIGYNKTKKYDKEILNVLSNAKKIITVSKDNYRLLNTVFPNVSNKTVLIPNGYNDKVFFLQTYNKEEVLKELKINKKYNKIITYVGKLVEVKGIDILLKAATLYQREDILTLIAGEGVLLESLQKMAKELKLKNVEFIGNQTQENLRKIYNISDVVVVPSRSEAFGLVIIESLACGTPVIGSNVGGIPDIITPKTGILFDENDYIGLAQNILNIINNKLIFDSKFIAQSTKDKYSQDKIIDNVIDVYKKLKNR